MALRARSDRSDPSAPEPPADKAPEDRTPNVMDDPGLADVNAATTWASTDRQASGRTEQRRRLPDLRVAALTPPVIAIRWGALAVGFALASADVADGDVRVLVFGGIILAYAVFRTLRPIRYEDGPGTVWSVLAELALCVVVVCATGYWESPFVFSLMTAVIAAGFARGFTFAINCALGSAAAVAVPYMLGATDSDQALRRSAQWAFLLLLVAMVAGYARRIFTESERQQSLALDRLGRLVEANELLESLHRVAQSLPASLDLDDVLDSTMIRLHDLMEFDSAVLLVLDETDATWVAARRDGPKVPSPVPTHRLPPPLRRAMTVTGAVSEPNLLESGGPGLSPSAGAGIYASMRARGSLIGLISVERTVEAPFTARDLELLNRFAEPAALAVDNARWFNRLRTIGADEERTRIARDLHDRIGQSLAYLAFELDRIVRAADKGESVRDPLDHLRHDVRGVIGEVRDTLYDLRTDVSEVQDMTSTLKQFLERVSERSGLRVTLRTEERGRLPLLQEREIWRITKEAVANVEKHARASQLAITWRCDGHRAELVVSDDGVGLGKGQPARLDSYGIIGMRERAASIGARLDFDTNPGGGTAVRVWLDPE
jgi:signal transduction histidine kinase